MKLIKGDTQFLILNSLLAMPALIHGFSVVPAYAELLLFLSVYLLFMKGIEP